MSPEQIPGARGSIAAKATSNSFAPLLYFLFTGVEPFAGRDLQEIMMKHLQGRPCRGTSSIRPCHGPLRTPSCEPWRRTATSGSNRRAPRQRLSLSAEAPAAGASGSGARSAS